VVERFSDPEVYVYCTLFYVQGRVPSTERSVQRIRRWTLFSTSPHPVSWLDIRRSPTRGVTEDFGT
jgi:hypothetical protein